ncbi:MAG: hypothetical protein AAF514_06015 [Verrucomicrobiota bacterium]
MKSIQSAFFPGALFTVLLFFSTLQLSLAQQGTVNLTFSNETRNTLEIHWKDRAGKLNRYASVRPGRSYEQASYPGNQWVIVDPRSNRAVRTVTCPNRASVVTIGHSDLGNGNGGHSGHRTRETVHVTFSNRSLRTLRLHKDIRGKAQMVGTIRSGKVSSVESYPGQLWYLEDPAARKFIKTHRTGSRRETVEITEAMFRYQETNSPRSGGRALLTFVNRADHPIDLVQVVEGRERFHSKLRANNSVRVQTTLGSRWLIGNPEARNYLRRVVVSKREQREVISDKDYRRVEYGYEQSDDIQVFNLQVENRTARTLVVQRPRGGGRRGRQKEIEIKAWTAERFPVRQGARLQVFDPRDSRKTSLSEIVASAARPVVRITPEIFPKIRTEIVNRGRTGIDVFVGQQAVKDNYRKRLSPGRSYSLRAREGDQIIITDSRSGTELKRVNASSRMKQIDVNDAFSPRQPDYYPDDRRGDSYPVPRDPRPAKEPSRDALIIELLKGLFGRR